MQPLWIIPILLFLSAAGPSAHADPITSQSAVQTTQNVSAAVDHYLGGSKGGNTCAPNDGPVDCLDLYENFCKKLYAPGNEGNLTLKAGNQEWDLGFGKTKNELDKTFLAEANGKILARDSLPPDFKSLLEKQNYFNKLQKFLKSKASSVESIDEQTDDGLLSGQLSSIWNGSIAAVAKARTDQIHPGYHNATYVPPLWDHDATKITNGLKAEIHADIWKDNPKWKEVQKDFDLVKAEYLKMLEENPKLTPDVKKDWMARISTISLSLPGADPKNQGDEADSCASTEENAFYSTETHSLTVCAGLFNSMDPIFVMSHEISHSLDPGSTALLQELNSDLGKGLKLVEKQLCASTSPACPSSWTALKAQLQTDLANYPKPEVQNESFLSCLKSQDASDPINLQTLKDSAKSKTIQLFSDNADAHFFLDYAIPDLTLNDGKSYPNPEYLKPYCEYQDWRLSPTSNVSLGAIFSAEYACEDPQKTGADRLSAAMATAKIYYQQISEKAIPLGGKFSTNSEMVNAGFAENVQERFADSMGLRVTSRILKNEKDLSTEQKRDKFLAAGANFCDPPSDETKYPAEANVEKGYSNEPHSLNGARRRELLIRPIREAIDCKLDDGSLTRDCDQI